MAGPRRRCCRWCRWCRRRALPRRGWCSLHRRRRPGRAARRGTERMGRPAALGGMLRSVALEIPAMQLACLDPGRGGPVGVGLGPAHAVETDVFGAAADGGARMVPQLGPSAAVDAVAPAMPGKHGLAYAVTGGLGGLGLLMADALAHQAARQVVLTGRSGRAGSSSSLRGLCEGWRGGGPSVVLVRCDASASDERAACFGTGARVAAQPGCGMLGGVLHAAGVLADGMAVGQTASRMRVSFAPKVPSAAGVATTAQLQGLQMCVQFSSISALCGSSGQTNYASSNSVLDYLSASCRADR